ncbi:DUF998 domain-containing protein [Cellulomonas sp. DKR-3]|uniref:DUF998 domain-containing protein n=1 Tax=Cellulomonas fulva TaxID=2835530 RepID=A0ABS5TWM8_9CELL|nr:DUF998 domain-containing protein [Cellulomonas fulva]MBT0993551.1 DUF998 domain-containing protein [Cellulomonas fulva]
MRTEPSPVRAARWAVVPAVVAPVAMIGGWTLAESLQDHVDPVAETISSLAAAPSSATWVMTTGLALTGLAHVATAAGLRPVAPVGRALHAVGGLATLAVAALPVDQHPRAHGVAAAVGFGALALWPALGVRRGGTQEAGVLRPAVGLAASGGLLVLLALFVAELQGLTPDDGAATGLTERLLAGAQALWPLVVVVALLRTAPRTPTDPPAGA